MLTDKQREKLAGLVGPMQIIIAALAAGIVTFLIVVLAIADHEDASDRIVSYMAAGFAAFAVVGWLFVPSILVGQDVRSIAAKQEAGSSDAITGSTNGDDIAKLSEAFQRQLITAAALLEGAAFFNLTAYLVEGWFVNLIVATLLLFAMVSQFPTRSRLEDWMTYRLEDINQMRAS